MWTIENRGRYGGSKLRYPSDLTHAEWALVAPLIPRAKRGGNKRTVGGIRTGTAMTWGSKSRARSATLSLLRGAC
jgi:transposase